VSRQSGGKWVQMLVWTDPALVAFAKIVIRLLNFYLPCTQPFLLRFEIEQVVILIAMTVHDPETEEFNPVMIGTILAKKVVPDLFAVLCGWRRNSLFLASRERQERENNKSCDSNPHMPLLIPEFWMRNQEPVGHILGGVPNWVLSLASEGGRSPNRPNSRVSFGLSPKSSTSPQAGPSLSRHEQGIYVASAFARH
jgi:hypothetical protein